ncbi:SMI1/KNR4 family protein [Streptomyces sp. NPDC057854]|uniref:SMI1/KNR4 family protein n=1 Tax=unclassified Streptomyces TaxID=2593676 RepID=UPI0036AE8E3F
MTSHLVDAAWDRIDRWLLAHAPRTFATLAPPARDEDIRAAERELGVTFPPELTASLRRHDGARPGPEAFRFDNHDRPLGLRGIVEATGFLRGCAQGLTEEQAVDYWLPGYVQFGTYEVTSDGLATDCDPHRDTYGTIGRFFDETGTRFGTAASLGAYLTEQADRLETPGRPVVFAGRLIWEDAPARLPDWDPADTPPPGPELPAPHLPADPAERVMVCDLDHLDELAALVATLPAERVAAAARAQARRLAGETGLTAYPEVTAALAALDAGTPDPSPDGPALLRLRAVTAAAHARGDRIRSFAALQLAHALRGSAYRAVAGIPAARSLCVPRWRDDLHADLGAPPLPPVPDDAFWAALRNPAIDADAYADGYDEIGERV